MSGMFANIVPSGATSPAKAGVKVDRVEAPPAPKPPATFTVTFSGLSGKDVAQLRKVLENTSGVPVAKDVAAQIRYQTGDTGEFYSGLYVISRGSFGQK